MCEIPSTEIVDDDDDQGIKDNLSEKSQSSSESVDFNIESVYFNNEDKKTTDFLNTFDDVSGANPLNRVDDDMPEIPDDDMFNELPSVIGDQVAGSGIEGKDEEEEEDDKEEIEFKTKDAIQMRKEE